MYVFISESDPVCSNPGTTHISGDIIAMTCSMTFQGAWAPAMKYYGIDRGDRRYALESVNTGTAANNTKLNVLFDYSISYTMTRQLGGSDQGFRFSCVTSFPDDVATSTDDSNAATNVPDYEHTFTTGILTLNCKC